jgi:exonuclease III
VSGFCLLVGDLNITPESGHLDPFSDAGWTDAWSELRPQEGGFTFFEAGRLARRIDYVWVNRDLRPYLAGVDIAAHLQHSSGARVSDHVALQAALNLAV